MPRGERTLYDSRLLVAFPSQFCDNRPALSLVVVRTLFFVPGVGLAWRKSKRQIRPPSIIDYDNY